MPVNSRNKGAAFERYIVNKINDYFESNNIDKKLKEIWINIKKKDKQTFI